MEAMRQFFSTVSTPNQLSTPRILQQLNLTGERLKGEKISKRF